MLFRPSGACRCGPPISVVVFGARCDRVAAVLRGEFHAGDGTSKGLLVGAFLCGCWGRRLGHLVVQFLWDSRSLQSCANLGDDVMHGGWVSWGLWCWIAPGEAVTHRNLDVLL